MFRGLLLRHDVPIQYSRECRPRRTHCHKRQPSSSRSPRANVARVARGQRSTEEDRSASVARVFRVVYKSEGARTPIHRARALLCKGASKAATLRPSERRNILVKLFVLAYTLRRATRLQYETGPFPRTRHCRAPGHFYTTENADSSYAARSSLRRKSYCAGIYWT